MRNDIFPDELKKQAWETMNEILDKELPQKRKSRKILLFIISAISISGIILSIVFYPNNIMPNTEKTIILPMIKVKHSNTKFRKSNKSQNKMVYKTNINNNKSYFKNSILQETKQQTEQQLKKTISESSQISENVTDIDTILYSTAIYRKKREIYETQQISKKSIINEFQNKKLTGDLKLAYNHQQLVQKNNWYFHPYLGVKLYNSSVEGLTISSEINAGNIFLLNKRFLLDFSVSYTSPEIIYNTVEVLENNYNNIDLSDKFSNDISSVYNLQSIKYNIFEFSFHESYRITKLFTLSAGEGISFTQKANSQIKQNTNYPEVYKNYDLIKPLTFFSDINAQLNLKKNFTFQFGYKYYFKNYSVFNDFDEVSTKSVYLKKESDLMNFYLGFRYNFLQKNRLQ